MSRFLIFRSIAFLIEPLQVAHQVAGNPRSFFELAYIMLLAYVNRRKNFIRRVLLCYIPGIFLAAARRGPCSVTLKCHGRFFDVLFPCHSATEFWSIRSTITEVLVKNVYHPKINEMPKLIVDAGANFGLATLYLSTFSPAAQFICYEPSSETYRVLIHNLKKNNINFKAYQKALTNFDGTVRYDSGRSSMVRAIATNGQSYQTEEVACATLKKELDTLGIQKVDLLKFDVEGEEIRLFEGLADALSRVLCVIGETHSPELERELRHNLECAGFCVQQHNGHTYGVALHR